MTYWQITPVFTKNVM